MAKLLSCYGPMPLICKCYVDLVSKTYLGSWKNSLVSFLGPIVRSNENVRLLPV